MFFFCLVKYCGSEYNNNIIIFSLQLKAEKLILKVLPKNTFIKFPFYIQQRLHIFRNSYFAFLTGSAGYMEAWLGWAIEHTFRCWSKNGMGTNIFPIATSRPWRYVQTWYHGCWYSNQYFWICWFGFSYRRIIILLKNKLGIVS